MGDDKRTDHPNEVVVAPGNPTVHRKVSVSRAGVAIHDDDSASIDVGSENFRSSNATAENPRTAFQGRSPQQDDDVLQVCRILRTALNDQGDTWGSFAELLSPTTDVDATASDAGGAVLKVQVTRIERVTGKTIARGDPVARRPTVEERVGHIRAAIDARARRPTTADGSEMLLAIDAIRSPEYVDREVVDAFVATHHTYVAGLGYRAMWLVGPTGELSRRLC